MRTRCSYTQLPPPRRLKNGQGRIERTIEGCAQVRRELSPSTDSALAMSLKSSSDVLAADVPEGAHQSGEHHNGRAVQAADPPRPPANRISDRHPVCEATDEVGSISTLLFDCNFRENHLCRESWFLWPGSFHRR